MKVLTQSRTKDQIYYSKHRQQILDNLNTLIRCECGCWTTKSNIYNHKKSNRHINLMVKDDNKSKYHKCEDCNSYVQNMPIHIRTKKHLKNMSKKNDLKVC